MKVAACRRYGPPEVVEIVDAPRPEPRSNEVLLKVIATTVTSADWRIRAFAIPKGFGIIMRLIFGVKGPRSPVLGSEMVGRVAAIGEGVTYFKLGDRVIAFPGAAMGCHAEYRVIKESGRIIPCPAAMSDEEAAAMCFGGTTALYFLRDRGRLESCQRVLIIGASGSLGTAAIQLARHFGAEVTSVSSRANVDLVRSLGADHCIDYQSEDFTRNGQKYDLIFDTVSATTFAKARGSLTPKGRLLMAAADLPAMIGGLGTAFSAKKAMSGVAPERIEDMRFLAELAEAGMFRSVIDSIYPFSEIRSAHARVESGRKRGNVVVRVGES